jgi:transcriptional regulator with XRE-family HTH domain
MQSIGKIIESKLREKGLPISEFARRINTNRNNVYDIFHRESIDTSLLKKISEVIDFDFFQCFNNPDLSLSNEINQKKDISILENKIIALEKEITYLSEIIADKDRIIELLEERRRNSL